MMGVLASCTALQADMIPAASMAVEGLLTQGVCVVADPQPVHGSCPFSFADFTSFPLPTGDFSTLMDSGVERTGDMPSSWILSEGQSSLALCLFTLVGLGMFSSAPWVKRLSVGVLPEWYHGGGPVQIGHSLAVTPDCRPVPIYCLVQPSHRQQASPPAESEGMIVSHWRDSQFTSAVLASRGPPCRS